MQNPSRGQQGRCLLFTAQVTGLFLVFYLYVLLRVRPELFYQQKPDVFLFDSYFFATFAGHPGGLVEYASAFLSPLFAFDWLGALVVTLLAAFICLATRRFLAAIAGAGGWALFLVPALLILMVLGRYNHPLRLCVGLCVVLGLASVYVRIGHARWAVRLAALVVASALAYYAAAGLYVVFALLCGIFEWRIRRNFWLAAWCVLSALVVPLAAGVWLCELSVRDAYRGILLPADRYWLAVPSSALLSKSIRAVLLLFFPAAALAVGWRRESGDSPDSGAESLPRRPSPVAWLSRAVPHESLQLGISGERSRIRENSEAAEVGGPRKIPPNSREFGYSQLQRHGSGAPRCWVCSAVSSAALIAFGIAADAVLFDASTKCSLSVAYSAERERWDDVLTHASRLPPSDAWNVFQVNRALYHRGELLERMFAYPQVADSVPALTLQFESLTVTAQQAPLEYGDILFDLGRINESQHMAYEALEQFGERPHTLERLVYLHAVKGEPDAARRFLAVLERSLLHRDWARDLLQQLDADPTLAGLPVVASRRARMVQRDFSGRLDLETMLGQLLEHNPRNRMAFEYLMAYYLLTRQVDKMAANLHRFDDFGQAGLPRHCEEAILIHLDTTGSPVIDLRGRRIRPETQRRGAEFVQAAEGLQGNPAAFTALHQDFGDTYFFFYVFGHNDPRLASEKPSR